MEWIAKAQRIFTLNLWHESNRIPATMWGSRSVWRGWKPRKSTRPCGICGSIISRAISLRGRFRMRNSTGSAEAAVYARICRIGLSVKEKKRTRVHRKAWWVLRKQGRYWRGRRAAAIRVSTRQIVGKLRRRVPQGPAACLALF